MAKSLQGGNGVRFRGRSKDIAYAHPQNAGTSEIDAKPFSIAGAA
jgi:hypothetical protein